ncbi:VOC family protein [Streptomyces nigra]|uniref:VOC family protein n=1 Tax=Streptomyces nigra TaxID=1827580 RepID=UPI0038256130
MGHRTPVPTAHRPTTSEGLDIEVDDLSSAVEHARALGATVADFQPQADVRVLYDPADHRFCPFERTGLST